MEAKVKVSDVLVSLKFHSKANTTQGPKGKTESSEKIEPIMDTRALLINRH